MIEVISPFPFHSLTKAWRWINEHRDKIADDYFAKTMDEFVDFWMARDHAGRLTWGVLRDGEIGGIITSDPISPTVRDFHCLYSTEFWGRETVGRSLELVCHELFERFPELDKLSTWAFKKNLAIKAMAKQFGVDEEGILKGHTRKGGIPVDLIVLGLQRARFYEFRNRRVNEQPVNGREDQRTDKPNLRPEDGNQRNELNGGNDLANGHINGDLGHTGSGANGTEVVALSGSGPTAVVQDHSSTFYKPNGVPGSTAKRSPQPSE